MISYTMIDTFSKNNRLFTTIIPIERGQPDLASTRVEIQNDEDGINKELY